MKEKLTASNGLLLMPHVDGSVRWEAGEKPTVVTVALREFFLAERDKELGRWRWPENPDYVVYADGTSRTVIDERRGRVMQVSLHDRKVMNTYLDSYVGAAKAYDADHPEPKPWQAAKPGEVWLITLDGEDEEPVGTFDFDGTTHFSIPGAEDFSVHCPKIVAARRIWPEVSE